ncbi:hypothetical protein BOX15_Mlig015355g2 [Macrostomum lignano]|uniref:Uncharacterized protein n=1 Tax=Macrostomum lignano TaxID=282301 RepID=A0A267DNZ9_9PLAT|nr:hypothetical protein BOX15_Mlig015355g2 [Macrostomum lignano]
MAVKRKDFQKTSAYIHQFLLKLDSTPECAEVRDALNLALLHMQKYYRYLRRRLENRDKDNASLSNSSLRGLSPMTPPVERPERFEWRWQDLEGRRMSLLRSQEPGLPLGMSLALSASKTGDLETLKALHSNNPACLDECDGMGRGLLMYAVQFEQFDTADWLLRHGADVNSVAHDQSTALHLAVHKGLWNFTELLVNHRASVDCQDSMGRAPLHWAVTTHTTECLKILLKSRANPSVRDRDLTTPSMWACRLDNIDHFAILSRLVQVNEFADGMERDASGWTFLHWAVRRQEPLECLRTLITEENAVVTDMSGKNVLMVAAEQGSLPACKIIMEVGGKSIIDYRDQDSRSAVHLATIGGHGEVLNFLLDQGADMEARDRDHATPWDYAKQRQLNYCKLILASHYRQRCKDLELASQNSLQDQMRASVNLDIQPRPPATPPSSRSKSPSSSTRRRLRGVVAPVQQQQEEQREGHQDSADACDAENGFERREPDPSQQHRQPQQQQLQLLESYRTMDSEDFNAASSVAQESRRPTAARGGLRPTASPRSRTPQTPQTPQSPQQPPHPDRRLTRSQPPYKLQRQMAENNGSVDAVAAAGGGYAASEASQQQPPVTLSSQLPAPAPPPPAQFGSDGDSIAGGHPPRTPPDKQRLIGPPPQLMPLNYSGGGGAAVLRHQLHTEPTPPHLPPPQQLQAQQLPPSALAPTRKKKKAKGKRGGSGGSGGRQQSPSPSLPTALSSSPGQNGFSSSTAPLQPLQPPQHLSPAVIGGWQGYQRPSDLPPPVTPRSAVSGRMSASTAADAASLVAAGGFIPPPVGFGNASAENSPRTASPQQLGGSGGQQPIAKASVYLPSSGRPRPHRGLALQAQQAPDGRHHQQQQQ